MVIIVSFSNIDDMFAILRNHVFIYIIDFLYNYVKY